MARFTSTFSSYTLRSPDWGALLLTAIQLVILGFVGLFIIIAIINTVLGTGSGDTTTQPYA